MVETVSYVRQYKAFEPVYRTRDIRCYDACKQKNAPSHLSVASSLHIPSHCKAPVRIHIDPAGVQRAAVVDRCEDIHVGG